MSAQQPAQPPRFFLDRSLGRIAVPEALRADGWEVITLARAWRSYRERLLVQVFRLDRL
jgi:hypothetical protein